jgi:hypothetical protein
MLSAKVPQLAADLDLSRGFAVINMPRSAKQSGRSTPCSETVTYLRMLDADAEGADWRDVARIVLHLDPENEPDRARRAFESPFVARQMDDGARLPAPRPLEWP